MRGAGSIAGLVAGSGHWIWNPLPDAGSPATGLSRPGCARTFPVPGNRARPRRNPEPADLSGIERLPGRGSLRRPSRGIERIVRIREAASAEELERCHFPLTRKTRGPALRGTDALSVQQDEGPKGRTRHASGRIGYFGTTLGLPPGVPGGGITGIVLDAPLFGGVTAIPGSTGGGFTVPCWRDKRSLMVLPLSCAPPFGAIFSGGAVVAPGGRAGAGGGAGTAGDGCA
jgi:hypothetical protein